MFYLWLVLVAILVVLSIVFLIKGYKKKKNSLMLISGLILLIASLISIYMCFYEICEVIEKAYGSLTEQEILAINEGIK